MIEWVELLSSVLSNRTEVHSFELGLQFALLTVLILRYTTRKIGGTFLCVTIPIVFFIQPIHAIEVKPWYFLAGLLLILSLFESLQFNTVQNANPTHFPSRVINHFRRRDP